MEPEVVCARLGGIARTVQFTAVGVSKRALRQAVAHGALLRLREGVYAHPAAGAATVHAARHGGRLACTDALRWHGLWVLPDDRFHIALQPSGRFHQHDGCDATLVRHWDAPVATLGRTVDVGCALAQLSHCGSDEAFLVALESALAGRRPKLDDAAHVRLRTAVRAEHRSLMCFAVAGSESGIETLVRWRLHRRGIHSRPQVDLPGVGRVDLVIGDRLIIEVDGRAYHSSDAAFAADRRRDAAAAALGFVTLRFSYAQVMYDWPDVEAAVLAILAGGLHETEAGRRLRSSAAV